MLAFYNRVARFYNFVSCEDEKFRRFFLYHFYLLGIEWRVKYLRPNRLLKLRHFFLRRDDEKAKFSATISTGDSAVYIKFFRLVIYKGNNRILPFVVPANNTGFLFLVFMRKHLVLSTFNLRPKFNVKWYFHIFSLLTF